MVEQFLNAVSFIVSDLAVFVVVQGIFLAIVVYASLFARKKHVRPRFKSYYAPSHFVLAYSIVSASIVQAVGAADIIVGFKLIIIITNLAAAFYLAFYNIWFRDMIVQVLVKSRKRTGPAL